MRKRPLSVTVIGWIFIVLGGIALVASWVPLAQRLAEFKEHPFEYAPVFVARVLAVLCGVFMLCGLLFAVVVYFLFRPRASAYFRDLKAEPPQIQKTDDTPMV